MFLFQFSARFNAFACRNTNWPKIVQNSSSSSSSMCELDDNNVSDGKLNGVLARVLITLLIRSTGRTHGVTAVSVNESVCVCVCCVWGRTAEQCALDGQ